MGLFSFLTQDIAVDLGTANTIIICNDKMVVNETLHCRYRPEDRKGYRYWRKSPADAGKDT